MGVGNKRGKSALALLFYTLFSLMLAAFFIIAVMSKVKAATNDSLFYKKYASRDLALIVDSLHAVNGEFVVNYEMYIPAKAFMDVSLEKDKVLLTDRSDQPVEMRAQTSFVFGSSPYVEVIPVMISAYPLELDVVATSHNITFRPKPAMGSQPAS
jgi:hypothetical protein